MRRSLLALAVLIPASAQATLIRPLPAVLRPVADETRTWDTRHFRIRSEIDLSDTDLKRISVTADSTARAVESHEVPWFTPPRGHRPELRIFRGTDSYEEGGGTPGSAGCYLWREARVVLNAEHLFPAVSARSRLKAALDEATVVHEIVHLCMHGSQGRLPQWFSEGVCEYYAAAHIGGGQFDFRDMDREIRRYHRRRFGDGIEEIPALPVAQIVGLDSRGWLQLMMKLPAERRFHGYVTALYLAHYYLHGPDRRDEILACFSDQYLKSPESFESLKDQGAQLEASLAQYWRPRGVRIGFGSPPQAPFSP